MASQVYTQEEISLQDGTDVVLRPLVIGRLRRFMKAWEKISGIDDEAEGFEVFVNCAGIALENNFKGKFDTLKATVDQQKNGEFLSPEYKEYLEDTLDLDTIYKVLDVCGGLKLNDPNLIALAENLDKATNQEEDGTV